MKILEKDQINKNQFNNIIGKSKAIKYAKELALIAAGNDNMILIQGESGVGKEYIAHSIHCNSQRKNKPFVKVNFNSLPNNFIEYELFGYKNNALTNNFSFLKGKFELADQGTILLDQIENMPLNIQNKILKILQTNELEKPDDFNRIKIDIRIICTTNVYLEKLTEESKSENELYQKLNYFHIYLPPLRERKIDILALTDYFVEKYSKIHNKNINRISMNALDVISNYSWPGNVRELESCIEKAVTQSLDEEIHSYHLPLTVQSANINNKEIGLLEIVLDNTEKEMIIDALKKGRGKISSAAKILGLTERKMGLRIDKYSINPKSFKYK